MDFRRDINGLRAIAVIAVALYHFGVPGFGGGFVGVDVFFVVSGYLMTRIILGEEGKAPPTLLAFYLGRARRILPALAVLCLVLAVGALTVLSPLDLKQVARQIIAALAFASNMHFLGGAGYFDGGSKTKLLLHTWSLSIEWQFYLIYPLLLHAAARLSGSRSRLLPLALAAFVASLLLCVIATQSRPVAAFYLLPTRAWEMLAGGVVFLGERRWGRFSSGQRRLLEGVGLLSIMASILAFDEHMAWPGYAALLPVVGTAMVLMAARSRPFLTTSEPAQAIGCWSYSVYLWHWPIVVAMHAADIEATAPIIAAGLALSVVAGYLSFTYVEQPARKLLQVRPRRTQIMLVTASLLLAALPAAAAMIGDGLPLRAKAGDDKRLRILEAALGDSGYPVECGRTSLLGRLRLCSLEGRAGDAVLFVGDSEVEQWWPRIAALRLTERPTVLFATYGGCPPFAGINRLQPGYRCPEFHGEVRKLLARPDIGTVVFGAAWAEYFVGTYGDPRPQPAIYATTGSRRTPIMMGSPSFDKLLVDFSNDLARLVRAGKRVVVILPVPGQNANPTLALYNAAWQNRPEPDLSFPVDGFRQYARQMTSALQTAAARAGAETVDPVAFLCGVERCPVIDAAGAPLYKDGTHLRPFAVRARAHFLDDLMQPKSRVTNAAP